MPTDLENPPVETETQPTPTQEAPKAPYVSALEQLQILREGKPVEQKPKEEIPPAAEEPKEEAPKPGAVTLPEPKADIPAKGANRQNWEKLEQAKAEAVRRAEEAERRLAELQNGRSGESQKIAELEQTIAALRQHNPDGLRMELEQAQAKNRELQTLLRAASIERDPEFTERFVAGKKHIEGRLKDLAAVASFAGEDVERALRYGQEDRLAEMRDSLSPAQQRQWDAALLKMAELDLERDQAVQNSEKTWEQLKRQRQEAARRQQQEALNHNLALRSHVVENIFGQLKDLQGDADLRRDIEETLEGVAGGKGAEKWTPENIMGNIAMTRILAKVNRTQAVLLSETEKQRDEFQKKVAELEAFLQKRGLGSPGSAPVPEAKSEGFDSGKRLVDQIEIRVPGR